jgi:hypothetical protein
METLKQGRAVSVSSFRSVPIVVRPRAGKHVLVTGDFSDWSHEGLPMKSLGDGRFRATLRLAPGNYEYRLIVDGTWSDDLDALRRVSNPFGGENAILEVS